MRAGRQHVRRSPRALCSAAPCRATGAASSRSARAAPPSAPRLRSPACTSRAGGCAPGMRMPCVAGAARSMRDYEEFGVGSCLCLRRAPRRSASSGPALHVCHLAERSPAQLAAGPMHCRSQDAAMSHMGPHFGLRLVHPDCQFRQSAICIRLQWVQSWPQRGTPLRGAAQAAGSAGVAQRRPGGAAARAPGCAPRVGGLARLAARPCAAQGRAAPRRGRAPCADPALPGVAGGPSS